MLSVNTADSFPGPLGEARAASAAGGGTSLSTTAALIPLVPGTARTVFTPHTYTTAIVAKYALNPWLYILRSDNNLGAVTDYSTQAQKSGGTGLTLDALTTKLAGGGLYVGSHLPWRGMAVTIPTNVNANASVLLGEYWNGSAWVSLSVTDGTATGGKTFAQTGNITWTVPASTAWVPDFLLNSIGAQASQLHQLPYSSKKRYWTRFTVSAALSASVSASLVLPLNRSTNYAEALTGVSVAFRGGPEEEGISCIEALTDAGTAKAIVNCYAAPKGQFS